jgi:hypothetical protein
MASFTDFLDEQFDDTKVPVSTGVPEPVPPGRYTLQCEKEEMAYTASGTGIIFKVSAAIVTGEYAGRMIYMNFNVKNNSEQAVTIGVGELKALVASLGIPWETFRSGDTSMILYKPFEAELGMEKENINPKTGKPYPPRNRVTKYVVRDPNSPAALAKKPATPTKSAAPTAKPADNGEVPF